MECQHVWYVEPGKPVTVVDIPNDVGVILNYVCRIVGGRCVYCHVKDCGIIVVTAPVSRCANIAFIKYGINVILSRCVILSVVADTKIIGCGTRISGEYY